VLLGHSQGVLAQRTYASTSAMARHRNYAGPQQTENGGCSPPALRGRECWLAPAPQQTSTRASSCATIVLGHTCSSLPSSCETGSRERVLDVTTSGVSDYVRLEHRRDRA